MKKKTLCDWVEAVLSRVNIGADYRKNKKIKRLERKTGADFGGRLYQSELGFGLSEGNDYTASPDYLLDLCKRFKVTQNDSAIDLGCGKGYAMYLMSKFSFFKIVGIEKSRLLCEVAKENISILFEQSDRFDVFCEDATKLSQLESIRDLIAHSSRTFIYIYNSFPYSVMDKVISELINLSKINPGSITIWYACPTPENLQIMIRDEIVHRDTRLYKYGGKVYVYEI